MDPKQDMLGTVWQTETLIKKDAYITFYIEKETLYLENDALEVGFKAITTGERWNELPKAYNTRQHCIKTHCIYK